VKPITRRANTQGLDTALTGRCLAGHRFWEDDAEISIPFPLIRVLTARKSGKIGLSDSKFTIVSARDGRHELRTYVHPEVLTHSGSLNSRAQSTLIGLMTICN